MLVAAWITAIATAGLLVGATTTAIFAIKAFGGQSGQLKLQRQELDDQRAINEKLAAVADLQVQDLRASLAERKREAAERERTAATLRRLQASEVFLAQKVQSPNPTTDYMENLRGGQAPRPVEVTVRNTSKQPIYDLELRWQRGSAPYGEPAFESLGTLMPGESAVRTRSYPADTNFDVAGAVAVFRDSAGIIWMRRRDGELLEWPPGQGPAETSGEAR